MTTPDQTEFRQTTGNAGIIGITAFGGALVGFVLQLIAAYYFGAGNETDAYFMAQSTSELLSKLLMGGSITAVFIPMFVERLSRNKSNDAWHLALNILHLTAAVYIILVAVLFLFAEPFIRFIAPGFTGETFRLTVSILRLILPSFFFLFLVEFATSMLHSLKQFTLPALLRIVAPTVSIITVILLVQSIGIYSLAIGALIGSIIQFLILAAGLKRQGFVYHFVCQPGSPDIKRLIYLVYPFLLSVLVTQGAGIVYRILVSDLVPGSLASLKFAEKITQLLTIMFLNSVTLVIFPILAEKASRHDVIGMRNTVSSALRLVIFTLTPVVIGVALLREPFIAFIYQRGTFSETDSAMTSLALLFFVIGLITNGISSILGYTVLALKETRASVAVSIASQAIAISLFVLLVPKLQHAGLALASSLVPLSITLLYFLYLTRFIPNLGRIFWHRTYVKIMFLGLALAAAIHFTQPSNLPSFWQVVIPAAIGTAVFFGGAYILKIEEMHEVLAIITGKIKKWKAA